MSSGPRFDVPISYSIRVPSSWFEIDVRPATRDSSAAELVRQRVKEAPDLRERRAEIARLLRRQAAAAWDAGAVYCAVMAEVVADGLLPGSVTVSFPPGPLDADSSAEDRFGPLLAPFAVKMPARQRPQATQREPSTSRRRYMAAGARGGG